MFSYYVDESQNGSHFFIKTPKEGKYLFQIQNIFEEYTEEYLEDNIQNSYIHSFVLDHRPQFLECCELFDTIRHIIFTHVSNNDTIVKIEIDKESGRKDLVLKFFNNRPDHIEGLTHEVNGITIYYFFSSLRITSTTLIKSLVKEFGDGSNNEEEE